MTTGPAVDADGAASTAPPAIDDATFDAALKAVRGDSAIQFDFPHIDPPSPPPQWLKSLFESLGSAGPFVRFLFWAVVAVAVLALLYLLVRAVQRRWSAPRDAREAVVPDWRPEEAAARELLREAEALAAAGDYAGAARLLLWRSIEDIQARKPDFVRPALTSREIAGADALPPTARRAFALIAGQVEASHFAARGLDAEGWRACREAYEAFAFDQDWARGQRR
ncbi:hypothetical protein [Sphingomonas sanxanigenens]|uniref:DUF4129 domain-containing protein n=1 Tax=Sphingomonas sanxanigenens DSM 19645 = NX02 TaxID=1123269 RepID=W0ABL3_9SPHN|nr:hypothetical protein [Sphingomonas sanxanigenens]AHE53897.1 hypothetical protein NX02_10920 [Sphingomonas sanxanigenens DSM 19645 = NX02]